MKKNRFTGQAYEKLQYEYEKLLKSRPYAVEELKEEREIADLSENSYYKASRSKLASIDHRLFRLKMFLKQAVILIEPQSTGAVMSMHDDIKFETPNGKLKYSI